LTTEPTLLVLDYPGRRPEAPVTDMNLDRAGYDCAYLLTTPLPTALSTAGYARELCARPLPARADGLIAYCAAAPLAVEVARLLAGPAEPAPIVLLDPQPTPPSEINHEYLDVVRQVEGRSPILQRPPLLDIEGLLGTPATLVECIEADLRRRAQLALAAHGVHVDEASGPVEGVVGVYVEWLIFLVAAHHSAPAAGRGPVLQVISRGHPDDAGWLGATDLRTVRIDCDRPELAAHPQARAAVLDFLRPDRTSTPTEPVTDTELELARMWAGLLGIDRVERGDDFFDLGGDSMLATVLILNARRTWNVEFSVRAVIDAPALKDLAALIDGLVATRR
jgi:hypothetical protein